MTKKVLFNQYYQTLSAILKITFFINCVLKSHFFKIALIEIVIPNGPLVILVSQFDKNTKKTTHSSLTTLTKKFFLTNFDESIINNHSQQDESL
jgi:hypothetical protein